MSASIILSHLHFIYHKLLKEELDESHEYSTGSENTPAEKNLAKNSVDTYHMPYGIQR